MVNPGQRSPGVTEREGRCGLIAELLAAFLDGSLTARRRAQVEAHLAECERCRWIAVHAGSLLADRDDSTH